MAYNPGNLQKVEWAVQSAFGTAETTGFAAVEVSSFTPNVQRTMHERPAVRSSYYKLPPQPGSQAGQEITLTIPILHGVSTTSPVAEPTANFEAQVVRALLGGQNIGGYAASAVAASGSTSSAVAIDNGTASSSYEAGQAVIFPVGSAYQIGWVSTVTDGGGSDHTLDLFQALTAAPTAEGTTYGTVCNYLANADPIFFTIRAGFVEANSRLVHEGCVPKSMKIKADPGGVLSAEITMAINSTSLSSGALSSYSYTAPTLPPVTGNNYARAIIGGSALATQTMEISLSQDLEMRGDWNAASGYAGMSTYNRQIQVSFTTLLGATAPSITNTQTAVSMVLQCGGSPGNIFGVLLPAGVHMEVGSLAVGNLVAQSYLYEPGQYTADAGSTAPADSEFRIVWG